MKYCWIVVLFFSCKTVLTQDGKIIEKKSFLIPDSVMQMMKQDDPALAKKIADSINFFRITYLSDGLKVIAYVAEPKATGKYPCIICNRGGNRDFGQWNPVSIAYGLGRMASWDYIVAASQYRGNDGGEGKEEFGGKDVDDVLNLVPVLQQSPKADTARIGMQGTSRGGMMTYLSLKKSCRFKAAVIISGMADAFINIKSRPDMENVFAELAPGYASNKENALKERSVVFWADHLCKTTPLLIMHGSSDWRVLPEESLELADKLYKAKQPFRFIFFEGGDHGIHEFRDDRNASMKKFFDTYLRDRKPWPSLEPHGQ